MFHQSDCPKNEVFLGFFVLLRHQHTFLNTIVKEYTTANRTIFVKPGTF